MFEFVCRRVVFFIFILVLVIVLFRLFGGETLEQRW